MHGQPMARWVQRSIRLVYTGPGKACLSAAVLYPETIDKEETGVCPHQLAFLAELPTHALEQNSNSYQLAAWLPENSQQEIA